ncbi:MAG: 50S ribosomal protein L30 [Rickettsiales bacterium]|nr:50S ribosomal protein L30 [Rickettsiales bacterium]
MANKKLKVKLTRSLIGQTKETKGTVKGLGLKRLNSEATLEDTASVRGMINKISHLVKIIG